MNSRDSFPTKKFQNRAPKRCRPGVVLSPATISFELHVKVAKEIDLEICSYGQLSQVQMLRDLDLGSGQGHTNIHSACSTTSVPNRVTVAPRTREIWPFEYCEIWTFGEV